MDTQSGNRKIELLKKEIRRVIKLCLITILEGLSSFLTAAGIKNNITIGTNMNGIFQSCIYLSIKLFFVIQENL